MDQSIAGTGELIVNGDRGPCSYRLTPWDGEVERGDGWLSEGQSLLEAAFTHGGASLRIEDGRRFDLRVIGLSDGTARITYTRTVEGR